MWPTSTPVRYFYRRRQRPENWERFNRRSKQLFARHPPPLDAYQKLAVEALRKDGIHVSRIEHILPGTAPLGRLRKEAERLMERPEIQSQIVRRRSRDGAKWYVIRAFGSRPALAVPQPLAEVFLNERLLGIVNAYHGLWCRLLYLDVWHNLPAGDAEHRIDSEYWHRDNHDRKIVKLFVYLNDVGEHAGPLTFLRETQADGAYGSVFPAHPPEGSYPNEKALIEAVPESRIVRCTGPAGTVVLCDTMGFHKGGRCARNHRLLLTATYTSDAALDFSRYRLARPEPLSQLSPMARYAIRAPLPTGCEDQWDPK